jgi:SNF2 family DNA or RNA helicase
MLQREKEEPCGGILCDEMGLGKTIQLLGLLKQQKREETLLIAPVAVLSQWEETARRARIAVFRPHVTARYCAWTAVTPVLPGAPKLYILGYEAARTRRELLLGQTWDRLIVDEAHRAAGGNSNTELLNRIPARSRWFLTATPVVNGLNDIVHLLELVGVKGAKAAAHTFASLKPLLETYLLARSMDDLRACVPDAPPKPTISVLRLPFRTEEEAEFYKGMSGVIVKKWKALNSEGGAGAALMKLQLYMRLRQLSLHPQVFISARRKALGSLYERPEWGASSTKFDALRDLIASGKAEGRSHKWIVFCHFHPEMELLKEALGPHVRNVWMYNGALNAAERKAVLKATEEPLPAGEADVLLIQLQSGGVGLNLQHFDRIVFTGPWWTAALMEQAIGRAVRIGQKEVVHVYHMILEEEEAINIDAVMREKAEAKGSLCKAVLEEACRDI